MPKLNNEAKMWLQQMQLANPGWSMGPGVHAKVGPGTLALDAFVYVADLSIGWTAAGAMDQAEFRRIRDMARANPEMGKLAIETAAGAIAEGADAQLTHGSEEAEACITMAVAALSQTRTFDQVEQSGTLAGHWVYAVYRARSGARIGRPCYFREPTTGLLSPENLQAALRQVVRHDAASSSSAVARTIQAEGGVLLHEKYRR